MTIAVSSSFTKTVVLLPFSAIPSFFSTHFRSRLRFQNEKYHLAWDQEVVLLGGQRISFLGVPHTWAHFALDLGIASTALPMPQFANQQPRDLFQPCKSRILL
mmetsp:Transcript_67101/g.157424  ORF Transcript_67101/g.157424 Transcript_67101/m.157424 type:complete len:103 (-) Transcript_67101:234-542(-)